MNSKRNHHLQPNFYLKGFKSSDEGNPKVWVYEKGKPFYDGTTEQLQNPKHLTTEKAARKKDFYSFVKEDGTKEYEKYENILRDDFEEPAKPVIEKIRRFEEINENEKVILSKYIASMITRGLWFRQKMIEVDKKLFEKYNPNWIQSDFNNKYGETFGITIDTDLAQEMHELLQNKIGFSSKKKVLEEMHERITLLSELIIDMKWRFLVNLPNCYFFTSDNPVWYRNLLDLKLAEVVFPVSSNVVFSASLLGFRNGKWKAIGKNYFVADSQTIVNVRNRITRFALREIYCSQKAEWLVKFINNRIVK